MRGTAATNYRLSGDDDSTSALCKIDKHHNRLTRSESNFHRD